MTDRPFFTRQASLVLDSTTSFPSERSVGDTEGRVRGVSLTEHVDCHNPLSWAMDIDRPLRVGLGGGMFLSVAEYERCQKALYAYRISQKPPCPLSERCRYRANHCEPDLRRGPRGCLGLEMPLSVGTGPGMSSMVLTS